MPLTPFQLAGQPCPERGEVPALGGALLPGPLGASEITEDPNGDWRPLDNLAED